IAVAGRSDQLVVQIATDERYECLTSCVNSADRQSRRNLGDLRIIAGDGPQLELTRSFNGKARSIFAESCRFGLAAAIKTDQDHWRDGIGRGVISSPSFCSHGVGSWNQNGTRNGVPKKTAGLACLWIGLRRCLGKHAVFGAAQEMSCKFIRSQRKVVGNRAKMLKLSSCLHFVF